MQKGLESPAGPHAARLCLLRPFMAEGEITPFQYAYNANARHEENAVCRSRLRRTPGQA
jgi:hypothetical protein